MIRFKERPAQVVDMTGPCADRDMLYSWTTSLAPIVDYSADRIIEEIARAKHLSGAIAVFNRYFGTAVEVNDGPKIIDLTGADGNAMTLINNYAVPYARCLGMDPKEVRAELSDVLKKSGYDKFLQEFDKYFGTYVILER